MGRRASSPSSDHPVAGLVLPSVVGTGAATPCGQKGAGGPIEGAWSAPAERHSTTPGLTGSRVPATGPRRGGTARPRPELALPAVVLRDRPLLAPAEVGAVRPHALQHPGQLARQRHLRPLHAAAPGDPRRP